LNGSSIGILYFGIRTDFGGKKRSGLSLREICPWELGGAFRELCGHQDVIEGQRSPV
jgi:hypothetical protein